MPKILAIPFQASADQTLDKLLRSLAEDHPFLPKDFMSNWPDSGRIYVPAYIIKVEWKVNWTAEFGNHREEHYTTWEHDHFHTGPHKSPPKPVNHTRTVTDWRFGGGQDRGIETYVAYAGDDLPSSVAYVVASSRPERANLVDMSNIEPAKPFKKTANEVWSGDVQGRAHATIDRSIRRYSQGDVSRNWTWQGTIDRVETPMMCPVEIYKIIYNNTIYYFSINAESMSFKHDYILPKDFRAVIESCISYILPVLIIPFIIQTLGVGNYPQFWVFTALMMAFLAIAHVVQKAVSRHKSQQLYDNFLAVKAERLRIGR